MVGGEAAVGRACWRNRRERGPVVTRAAIQDARISDAGRFIRLQNPNMRFGGGRHYLCAGPDLNAIQIPVVDRSPYSLLDKFIINLGDLP